VFFPDKVSTRFDFGPLSGNGYRFFFQFLKKIELVLANSSLVPEKALLKKIIFFHKPK